MRRLLAFEELYQAIGKGRYRGDEKRKRSSFRCWLWRAARGGKFPAPVEIATHSVAWDEQEVEAALAGLKRATYAPTTSSAAA